MAIFVGSDEIFDTKLFLGGNEIEAVYYGNVLIWPVSQPPPPQATVSQQPTGGSFFVGDAVNLTCAFSYAGTLTYQWEISTDGGSNWAPISGQTTTSYGFTAALDDDGDQFRCVSTDEFARVVMTNAATVNVSNPPSGSQTFTSSGTFVVPAGVTQIRITAVGGGGGGGGGSMTQDINGIPGEFRVICTGGGGGAGGNNVQNVVYNVTPGNSYTVTIGAGGAAGIGGLYGGTNKPTNGGTGGTTSVSGPGISLSVGGGPPGLQGNFEVEGAPTWGFVYGGAGGSSWAGAGGTSRGRNGGGAGGERGTVNLSQSIPGFPEVGNGKIAVKQTYRAPNVDDVTNIKTSTGGGSGGSSDLGTGGRGGDAGGLGNGGTGANGGVGSGGGGGGATLGVYPSHRGGNGGVGGRGEVRISWG